MLLPVILVLIASAAYFMVVRLNELSETAYSSKTDPESTGRGKVLFDSKCRFCHYADSTEPLYGPGLVGIMKKERLPFSKRPSTPENIIRQLKKPADRMPAFEYLSEEEISDIIAFLYTL